MRFTILFFLLIPFGIVLAQNPLAIPPAMTGTTFALNVQAGSQTFYGSTITPTYGVNGAWMAPTIIVNKGDSISLQVHNTLNSATTMHWHGLHVAARNDGGPAQIINPSATWSPSFKVRNNAATYWYHPHGIGQTERQISKGLAGMLIVRDSAEAALALPRRYGIDDFPIILQSKAFDVLQQIAIATDMDTALFVNGTLNPYLDAPAQVIRLRLVNASSLRTFNLGLSNGQTFYQIATDGGLLDTPLAHTRLRLSPGERAEILINFSAMNGQQIYLRSFASELPSGIYGADSVGTGIDTIADYKSNFLNGADFNVLKINIVTATGGAITVVPTSLVPMTNLTIGFVTQYRTLVMDTIRLLPADQPNRADGPFGFNKRTFNMDSINTIVHLNTTEIWTLVNNTLIAHPFHIHDVQFNIIERSGMAPPLTDKGWKDVVLVLPGDSVKFIASFSDFADNNTAYMYHCHLLHHEDDGMMGSFIVIDTTTTAISELPSEAFNLYPNPTTDLLTIVFQDHGFYEVNVLNSIGEKCYSTYASGSSQLALGTLESGIYFIKILSDKNCFIKKIVKQ